MQSATILLIALLLLGDAHSAAVAAAVIIRVKGGQLRRLADDTIRFNSSVSPFLSFFFTATSRRHSSVLFSARTPPFPSSRTLNGHH